MSRVADHILIAALEYIESEMERIYWNITQKEFSSPFRNTGRNFKSPVFEVQAHDWDKDWGGEEQEYNFKYFQGLINDSEGPVDELEVSWNKNLGRGTYTNRLVSPNAISFMLDDIIRYLRTFDRDIIEHAGLTEEEVKTLHDEFISFFN